MKVTHTKRDIRWVLLSPTAAVVWSVGIVTISLLFPRGIYRYLLAEPDYISFDPFAALYVLLCVLAFVAGYAFHKGLKSTVLKRRSGRTSASRRRRPVRLLILSISAAFILINIYTLVSILSAMPLTTIFGALLGEQDSFVLRTIAAETLRDQNIGYLFTASTALIPWIVWNALGLWDSRRRLSLERIATLAIVLVLLLLILVNAVLLQSRGQLLYPVFAAFVAWAAFRTKQGRLKPKNLLLAGLALLFFALSYFALISITRFGVSGDAVQLVAERFVGYTVGSYNRFAAMLSGALVLPGGGGYYWTQWFWDMPVLSDTFDLQTTAASVFGTIPPTGWANRTAYISGAGLSENLTAFSVFGHSYIDFGWFGFAPFAAYGFLSRVVWMAFRDGKTWALILYPYVLWSIVEWRGYLNISSPESVAFVSVAVLVWVVDIVSESYTVATAPARRRRSAAWPSHAGRRNFRWEKG